MDAKAMKVVALCADVPALALTAANITVLLHPEIAAENLRTQVTAALERLVTDDRLREGDTGYRLQSPEQKDWEQARRAIDLTQGILRPAASATTQARACGPGSHAGAHV